MKKNIIQLNGKLYDAETGKIVQPYSGTISSAKTSVTKLKTPKKPSTSSKSIDGFGGITNKLKPKHNAKTATKPAKNDAAKPKAVSAKAAPKDTPAKPTRSHAKNQMRAQLQHTSTLRRSLVKKPVATKYRSTIKPDTTIETKVKHPDNNIKTTIKKSPLISRFSRPEPINYPASQTQPTKKEPNLLKKTVQSSKPTPVSKIIEAPSAKEALIARGFADLDKNKRSISKKPTKRQKIHHHVKKHRKTASIVAGGLAVLLIGLYVVYLNVPNMAIKFAASRAGFEANLPHYSPSGYSFNGPIKYQPGQVAISFKSNSDNRKYSVVEQPSQWDSEAVYNNYVSKQSNKAPYTIQDSGLTIYLFGDSSAAWVNGGKFFAINGKGSQLSNDQILSIATSL